MRKTDLMKALATGQFESTAEPPERAAFLYSDETQECCSILSRLFNRSLQNDPHGRLRNSIPLPDVDLPMIF